MNNKSNSYFSIVFCCLLVCSFVTSHIFAQDTKPKEDLKKIIAIGNNKFAVYNNWITGGAGYGHSFKYFSPIFHLAGDFNFHIRKSYFHAGVILAGEYFGYYNFYQAHLAYGNRIENKAYNLAWFYGLSYSQTYPRENGKYILTPNNQPGLYGCIQAVRKITYDVGVGLQLTADLTVKNSIIGLAGIVYFSGAFRGKFRNGEE